MRKTITITAAIAMLAISSVASARLGFTASQSDSICRGYEDNYAEIMKMRAANKPIATAKAYAAKTLFPKTMRDFVDATYKMPAKKITTDGIKYVGFEHYKSCMRSGVDALIYLEDAMK